MFDLNLDTNTALLFSTEMNVSLGGFLRAGQRVRLPTVVLAGLGKLVRRRSRRILKLMYHG